MKKWILYNKSDGTSWLVSPSGDKVQLTAELNMPAEHCDVVSQDDLDISMPLARMEEIVRDGFHPPDATTPIIQYHTPEDFRQMEKFLPERLIDKWPLLPTRSEKQRRDDGIHVNEFLLRLNRGEAADAAIGKLDPADIQFFRYSSIEPNREIVRKKD